MISIFDVRMLLPVITIVAVGYLEQFLIRKFLQEKKQSVSFLEILLDSTVFGTISLVVPMVFISILAQKKYEQHPRTIYTSFLKKFSYLYFTIGVLTIIYFSYNFVKKKLPDYILSEEKGLKRSLNTLYIIIVFLMFSAYVFNGLIYPLRGWDALHFYIPNAFHLFLTGRLPNINPLNFMPQFKPPLNIFLYAYAFYITLGEMIQLISFVYLGGTAYLCYKIAKQENLSKRTSLMVGIAFFATPLIYFMVFEYQYYQDIFIMFFTTASFYYFRRMFKVDAQNEKLYYVLLTSLSLTGCVLSKISGYILPIVIFVAMPSDKIGKILRSLIIAGLTYQLVRKSLTEIYIGTSILIFLLCIYCIFLVITDETLAFSLKRWLNIILIYSIPIIAGIFWLYFMFSISGTEDFLRRTYVDVVGNIKYSWPGIATPEVTTYIENAHTASFISSSFCLLLSINFASTWAIVKIFGLFTSHKKHKSLVIWLLLFFVIWQAFFGSGSIRYLTPIVPPAALITVIGFNSITRYLNKRDGKKRDGFLAFLFLIITSYLTLLPIIPFELLFEENFHLKWYYAHKNVVSLVLQIIALNLVVFFLLLKENSFEFSFKKIYFNKELTSRKVLAGSLIFLVVFVPMLAQSALIVYHRFDLEEFHQEFVFYSRRNYVELIDAVKGLGYPDDSVILSINTPGLEYYATKPVLDFFMASYFINAAIESDTLPFNKENTTKLLQFLKDYQIEIFITMNQKNEYYPVFLTEYYYKYYLFRIFNNNLHFTHRFRNSEFILYTLKSSYDELKPFIGLLDLQLKGRDGSSISLFARNQKEFSFKNDSVGIDALMDLTAAPTNAPLNISFSTEYSTFQNSTRLTETISYSHNKTGEEKFETFLVHTLKDTTTIIHNINVQISYKDKSLNDQIVQKSYKIGSLSNYGVNFYHWSSTWHFYGENGFMFI